MELAIGLLVLGAVVGVVLFLKSKKSVDMFPNEKLKKFEFLLDDFIEVDGKRLYRIVALQDFGEIKVGDKGGYLESVSNLSNAGKCWVGGDAKVYGNSRVMGNAQVSENATIYGEATITEDARVYGSAKVRDRASIYGSAHIYDKAEIFGSVEVYGEARIFGNAQVYENAKIFGNARVQMNALVYGNAKVAYNAKIMGDAKVGGEMSVENRTLLSSTHE